MEAVNRGSLHFGSGVTRMERSNYRARQFPSRVNLWPRVNTRFVTRERRLGNEPCDVDTTADTTAADVVERRARRSAAQRQRPIVATPSPIDGHRSAELILRHDSLPSSSLVVNITPPVTVIGWKKEPYAWKLLGVEQGGNVFPPLFLLAISPKAQVFRSVPFLSSDLGITCILAWVKGPRSIESCFQ